MATPGEPVLEVRDLEVTDSRGLPAVRGMSFQVRARDRRRCGRRQRQTELIEAITGLTKPTGGTIEIAGREISHVTAREMLDAGVGHIPEDRQRRGLVLEFSIAENVALHDYDRPPDSKWGWLFPRRLIEIARKLIVEFDVRGGAR
jgi:simple sugar transport system ATP-binding protein